MFVVFSKLVASTTSNVTPIIKETQAADYNGEVVTVEGVILYNFNSGKQTILSFHEHHRGHFKALIKHQYYSEFSEMPDRIYTIGTKIRVTGKLEWYQGDQTIYVFSPSQIEII